MQIEVEQISSLGRKINIIIPAEKINDSIQTKIKKISKQIKMNGFRPGHVPVTLIKEKYATAVYQEAIEELIDSGVKKVIDEYHLDPMEQLNLENMEHQPDNLKSLQDLKDLKDLKDFKDLKDLKCVFKVNVYPDFALKEFSELNINIPEVKISEEDIDNNLSNATQELGDFIDVDREAQLGDLLLIDYASFRDGKEISNNSSKNIQVLLGGNSFIEGFESGLIGAKAGDNIVLNLKFPKDYAEKSLANQPVEIKVHINKIQVKQLAEINEEFAYKLGIEDKDTSKIRDVIKENLEKHAKQLIAKREEEAVIDLLIKAYPVDELPEKLIISELEQLENNFKHSNQRQGINVTELNEDVRSELKSQAVKNVHLSLILRKIIQKYNLTIDEQLLKQKLYELEGVFKNIARKNAGKNYHQIYHNLKNSIINSNLFQIALDFVKQKVSKTATTLTFKELTD